jgi:hypothetical protein
MSYACFEYFEQLTITYLANDTLPALLKNMEANQITMISYVLEYSASNSLGGFQETSNDGYLPHMLRSLTG